MKLTVCAASDIGLSRSRNEDTYLCDRDNAIFIVADGMGGTLREMSPVVSPLKQHWRSAGRNRRKNR